MTLGDNAGTVLIVDDDRVILKLMEAVLTKEGYGILQAEDGDDAWEILQESHEDIDAVLLDRMMPRMDGMEVLRRIKAHPEMEKIPVIMETALIEKHEVAEGIMAGAYYYLTKPFDNRALVSIVRTAVSDYRNIESLCSEVRRYKKVLGLVRESRFEFRTLADARDLATFIANFYPEPEDVVIGLSELLINALEHGSLGIDYDMKSELVRENRWEAEVERRQGLPENVDKLIRIRYERTDGEIDVWIADEGDGFDWADYMELDPDRITDNHGRGIALAGMKSFDSIEFQGNGNEVLCRVRLTIPDGSPPSSTQNHPLCR